MKHRTSTAAVVVTYNRRPYLERWLNCIEQQTVRPDAVIIVDNGSSDGTAKMVRSRFPSATLIETGDNIGASGGAAAGMQHACDLGCDWIWMFDDDAFPEAAALERALATAEQVSHRQVGMVWLPFDDFGGWQWQDRKVPVSVAELSRDGETPFRVDQVDLNMTLVSSELVRTVGVPRADYFIMLWSCEYCLRVADAGYEIWVVPEVLVRHEHAGSTDCGLWRSYYQTRNQLAMALARKSPSMFGWWLLRQMRFLSGILLKSDRKRERLILRLRGMWHGMRGISGKIIDPADYRG